MKPQWKDITSYGYGDKERKPTSYCLLLLPDLSITIIHNHIYFRGTWIMDCYNFGINLHVLSGANTVEQAQAAAIEVVRLKLIEWQNALKQVSEK